MATHKHPIPGAETLKQQENRLNRLEQISFAKVIKYGEVSGTTDNEAELEHVPIGQQPGPLHLEAADDDTQAAKVIADQKKAGKTLAFQGKALVESKEKIVLGFR